MLVQTRFGIRFLFPIRGFRLRFGLYSSRLLGFKIELGKLFKSIEGSFSIYGYSTIDIFLLLMPQSVFDTIVGYGS